MKRLFSLVSLFVFLCFGVLSSSPAQASSEPTLVLPEKSFDFKEVVEGKVVEHAFKLLNKGNQPLEIKKIDTG